MAFRKAKAEQAAVKMTIYGPSGAGKTTTAMLFAEGLAQLGGKRVAVIDTERGTDFLTKEVPAREYHPKAFDFDAVYTRSITDVLKELRGLRFETHNVVVLDSVTHLWESCKAAYTGRTNKVGQFPMWAWQKIKAPWREMMNLLINSPLHVFILGRQGNEFTEDEETGEVKTLGFKMKAEGESAYEPHLTLRMETAKVPGKPVKQAFIPTAVVEKDRVGCLQGMCIAWPNYDKVIKPLLPFLGHEQAQIPAEDETANHDAEALAAQERDRAVQSMTLRREFEAKFNLAKARDEVEAVSKAITADVKRKMLTEHTQALRDAYMAALDRVRQAPVNGTV